MAFNNWPYTNFQDLNLGWILGKLGVVERLATDSAASVAQYDARITANTNAIGQLGIELDAISDVAKVFVNSNLEAYYRGKHITGSELVSVLQSHGTLPYVEYNGEIYMLDTVSNAGDLRFSMGHTVDILNELVIRHIMIPAQSYNAAYSITNVSAGGGGSSGNIFAVKITDRGAYADPQYICDHTYAEIYSQMENGRIPILLVSFGSNPVSYQICGMGRNATRTVSGQTIQEICFADPSWMTDSGNNNVGEWFIDANNYVGHIASLKQLATLDNIIQFVNDGITTNALIKTQQTLTAAEKAQVKQNLGITDGGDSGDFVLLRMDQNGYVYNGSTAITGTQINTLAATNKAVFLWDEDNERLYTYTEQGTSAGELDGTAEFVTPVSNGNGCYLVVVNAANNNSTFYENNVPFQTLRVAMASTDTTPTLDPNKLYVFPEIATLTPTLATPSNNNVENEYHFIFNSGSTPTTLTLPNTIRQPDGFTVEANHVYEVSILENNMTAQGWAVTA